MAELGTLAHQHDAAGGFNGDRGGRPLRRRRGLPGSRAVVGGLLVAMALVGTFAAYTSARRGPSSSYVVVRRDLEVGDRLRRTDLELVPMDLPVQVRARAFDDVGVLAGATVIGPLRAGDLVQASAVVKTDGGPSTEELSFAVDSDRALGGRLKAGERVDVLATYGTGGDAYTVVAVRRALVVKIEAGSSAVGRSDSVVLTLAFERPVDVLATAHALQAGKLTVVRATAAAPDGTETGQYRPAANRAPAAKG